MLNVQSDAIAKTIMLAKKGRWSHAAIAAIAVASLSLSVMSVAQAQGGEGTPKLEGIYNTTRNPATINRETPKPDAAFRNYPTWPKGGRIITAPTAVKLPSTRTNEPWIVRMSLAQSSARNSLPECSR